MLRPLKNLIILLNLSKHDSYYYYNSLSNQTINPKRNRQKLEISRLLVVACTLDGDWLWGPHGPSIDGVHATNLKRSVGVNLLMSLLLGLVLIWSTKLQPKITARTATFNIVEDVKNAKQSLFY